MESRLCQTTAEQTNYAKLLFWRRLRITKPTPASTEPKSIMDAGSGTGEEFKLPVKFTDKEPAVLKTMVATSVMVKGDVKLPASDELDTPPTELNVSAGVERPVVSN